MADYFTNRTGMPFNESGNTTPQTTTISTDETGKTTVTQKQVLDKNKAEALAAPEVQNPMQFVTQPPPQQYIDLSNSQGPMAQYAPAMPVAPQPDPRMMQQRQQAMMQQRQQEQQQAMLQAAAQTPVAQGTQTPETFGRMLQVESGGRQFNPDGSIVTSPKGAMGIAQIMPATAAQPGYGIKPATPAELATPEGNANFGQRYFEGMYNKFGDPEKAAAAYNAGPGTIEKAMLVASQQGGTWKDYIPAETKTYLEKVFKGSEETKKRFEPLIAGVPTSDVGMTPTEQAIYHLTLNSKDVNALGQVTYAGDHLVDKATKRAAADEHAAVLERNRMEQKAEKRAADLIMNGGAGMQRALRDESEEGSYLKAYLFKRLGLNDLAQAEQQKLGAGDMWAQTMVNGTPAWVKFNGQGAPIRGYNAEGELSEKDLITAMATKSVTSTAKVYKDRSTGELYSYQTTPAGPRFVSNSGQVYSGPTANLFEYGIGTEVPVAGEKAFQVSGQTVRGKAGAETGVTPQPLPPSGAPTGAVPTGPVAQQPGSVQQIQQGGTAVASPQGQAAPAQPYGANVQFAPGQARPQGPAVPGQAPAQAQAQPGQAPAQAQPSPTPGIPGSTPLRPPMPGESIAQYNAYKEAWDTEQKVLSEEVAKIKVNLPKITSSGDAVIKTVDDVLNHKGFTDVVGVPNILTGIYSPPGTNARDAKAKIKELEGKQFLQAFESLKGGGSITEREGAAATAAISALQDPGISEAEYRRNATIFKNSVRRMVNRQLEATGQAPKYPSTAMEIEDTKKVDGVTYTYDGIGWKKK